MSETYNKDIYSERVLISSLCANPQKIVRVLQILEKKHFLELRTAAAYEKICDLFYKTGTFDSFNVADSLSNNNLFTDFGGINKIISWLEEYIRHKDSDILITAENISARYTVRLLKSVCGGVLTKLSSMNHVKDVWSLLSDVKKSFDATEVKSSQYEQVSDLIKKARELKKTQQEETKTTFKELDKYFKAIKPSSVVVIGARTSMGKTALALNLAVNMAKKIKDSSEVLFLSLEMSSLQLAERIDLSEGRKQIDLLKDASNWHLSLDDTSEWSISRLRNYLFCRHRIKPIKVLFIDYLQLIKTSDPTKDRYETVTKISAELKVIAKELNIIIFLLSQLSREVEKRENKVPQLADLRDSGSIEQDADMVLLLWRPERYLEINEPPKNDRRRSRWETELAAVKGKAELIIAKNRNGPTGVVHLRYEPEKSKFLAWDISKR